MAPEGENLGTHESYLELHSNTPFQATDRCHVAGTVRLAVGLISRSSPRFGRSVGSWRGMGVGPERSLPSET